MPGPSRCCALVLVGTVVGVLSASPTGLISASPVTCKLPADDRPREASPLEKPDYLSSVTDPVFGARITRITGDPGVPVPGIAGERWGKLARHRYSKDQAWNADESLLVLQQNDGSRRGQALFLDGSTYEPLFARPLPEGEVRWHPHEPGAMLLARGDLLGSWDVRSNTVSVIRRFEGYTGLQIGPYEGNPSLDGRTLVLTARNPAGERIVFSNDLESGTKHADILLSGVVRSLDWASVSASGRYLVINDEDDRTVILDRAGKIINRFPEYGRPSHYDLTIDSAGEDVAVGVSKSPPDTGFLIARRLRDGAVIALTGAGFASHSSARSTAAPDRVVSDYEWAQDGRPYDGEIVVSSLSRRRVYRIAHHRNVARDYLSETQASPSVRGNRVIYASTWGAQEGRPVQAYVADFRSLCPDDAPHPFQ